MHVPEPESVQEKRDPEPTTDERAMFTNERLRLLAAWVAVVGTWALAAFFCLFLVYHSLVWQNVEESWMLTIIQAHYAATIGLPLCAVSAACIVLILESTSGPIKFEALGFKFEGASGPVILWLLCFLSMVLGLKLLWVP